MFLIANNLSAAIFHNGQVADSEQVFSKTAAILAAGGAITSPLAPPPPEYVHGSHQAAIMDRQICSSSVIFQSTAVLPSAVGLGTGRDFAITQDELPQTRPSRIYANSALLSSAGIQNPQMQPAIQTLPQYPLDQRWSVVYNPAPAPAAPPQPAPIALVQSYGSPQYPQDQSWASVQLPGAGLIPNAPRLYTSCGVLDFYDQGNGDVLVAWGPFGGSNPNPPDSYNVYVNGVLFTNVPVREALLTGLISTSYQRTGIPPTPNNSARPQSMPPVGVVTPSSTYRVRVVAVSAGFEVSPSDDGIITDQPTSEMLTTPMKRIFPFPNTGLN